MNILHWLNETDTNFLLWINRHHNSFWDGIMWFSSGELSWLPLYLAVLLLLIFKFKNRSWLLVLLVIPLIALSDQLAASVIKPLVLRPRPSHVPGLEDQLHYVNHYRGGAFGFVSNHACNVFAFATYITCTTAKKLKWLPFVLFPWAVLVSYSRVYLGVHYPGDVICGALLGALLGFVLSKVYFHFKRKNQKVKQKQLNFQE